MPKTGAERQRAWRQRRVRLVTTLKAEIEVLRADLAAALAEAVDLRAEVERLTAAPCQHPSGSVVDGVCKECGAEDQWAA